MQATNSSSGVEVTTDGTGVVGHAGAALLGELADRLGLTSALGWRAPGGRRRHPDAVVLRDLAVMLADGGDCLSDLAVLRDQAELFGPVLTVIAHDSSAASISSGGISRPSSVSLIWRNGRLYLRENSKSR